MKIYLLSQNKNRGYDTYDSCVVCAENEESAKKIHPGGGETTSEEEEYSGWTTLENVHCEEIGEANFNQSEGVICASYNAG